VKPGSLAVSISGGEVLGGLTTGTGAAKHVTEQPVRLWGAAAG
jgi:hypothetical protein